MKNKILKILNDRFEMHTKGIMDILNTSARVDSLERGAGKIEELRALIKIVSDLE